MPQETAATPQPQAAGADQQKQMQEIMLRLMQSVAKPRMQGPQAPPQAQQSLQTPGPQQMVHGLFSLIQQQAAKAKKTQLDHATFRIKGISDAIEDAYEHAQGDEAKAKQLFMESPAVQSLTSKEGQKDMKQMEKLLQYDFLNPEKSKTVWHEALEKVAKISGAEKMMKGLRTLMGQHKDKMAEEVKKQGEAQKSQNEATKLAQTMFSGARQAPSADVSKMLPSMISSEGANLRQREKELHDEHMLNMKNDFAKSIDSIKDPVSKAIARGIQLSDAGQPEQAQKYFDMAHKGAMTKKEPKAPSMTLNAVIDRMLHDPTPEGKKSAKEDYDIIVATTDRQLTIRGQAFGMSKLFNWVNQETGETRPMNGFQVQQSIKSGEAWSMISPLAPGTILSMQQIVRGMNMPEPSTGKSLKQKLESDMKVFDNASDRAIISRVLRANPTVAALDETSLGTWIDQNLIGQLSKDGQAYMQDIKQYAEVFARSRTLTGQSSSEMNTHLLLGLLPTEKTPNSKYGLQMLHNSFNYLDGTVEAPILGGGRFAGKGDTKPAPAKKADKSDRAISLD